MASERTKVFISYSHADGPWLEKVKKALKPLERDHGDAIWHDQKLEPGATWANEIQGAIDEAKVAVLLVSRDFMASDFIGGQELPPLLKAAQDSGAVILPVHVGRSAFGEDRYLRHIQGVNDPAKPLKAATEDEQDQVLENLRRAVLKALLGPTLAVAARAPNEEPADDEAAEEEGEGDENNQELVIGLTEHLEALLGTDSDLSVLGLYAVDADEQTALLMQMQYSDDGDLLLLVLGNGELPEVLQLPPKKLALLKREFDAQPVDDGAGGQVLNFGAPDDPEAVREVVCLILDSVFELPDDDFALIAEPIDG